MLDAETFMKWGDAKFKCAREKYDYIPAKLIKMDQLTQNQPDILIGNARLSASVPTNWVDVTSRQTYSSKGLDDFHSGLFAQESDEGLIHGLLSVVFWGYVSGTDKRVNAPRAIAKAKMLFQGRGQIGSQDSSRIIQHLIRARKYIQCDQIADAFIEVRQIKFLGMSFASKVLMFMSPDKLAVYDAVIGCMLKKAVGEMRGLYVNTLSSSVRQQTEVYERWCQWCAMQATRLNNSGVIWRDWDRTEQAWRAVDVERSLFALGK